MPSPPPFPLVAPFRIDQVTQAPQLLAALFWAQVALALAIQLAAVLRRPRLWWAAVGMFLALILIFFTLASWGNSDTTRFSHALQWNPDLSPPELLWVVLRPLILVLPYRMAGLHGLIATGFALAAVLVARGWRAPAWAGWWALLICCSPLLRGFLQNAHSRQALASLLLLPLFLQSARLAKPPRSGLGVGVLLSALSHNTFIWNLPISLSPWLVRLPELAARRRDQPTAGPGGWRRWLPWLLAIGAVLALLALVAPAALQRFRDYSNDDYFNLYPLRPVIGRLQRAMAFGLVVACGQRRLDPRMLLRCPLTQLLLAFGLLYVGIQTSIEQQWLAQITSRLADGVAFFLLILYLAWLHRYRAHWCLIFPLWVTLQHWLDGRILRSALYACGQNDEFLCVPDRWPWQVRY
ncbi:MAG: hypothetical protein NTZ40_01560 [Cyanobacteria bacterium]|nr:hypothetical protein [Cyanobacteriota bacterium]